MAWTAPITWVAGQIPTATILNAQIRDNLLQTMPAKATGNGSIFVGSGLNTLTERFTDTARIDTLETSSSTSYTNLSTVGPSVTLATGSMAFVFFSAQMGNSVDDGSPYTSYAVSGATTVAASDIRSTQFDGTGAGEQASGGMMDFISGLTPGTNTFTMKYRVASGTGNWQRRTIGVLPLN